MEYTEDQGSFHHRAGDSSIAGFIAATKDGYSYRDMLKRAISYGSAACMTEGTRPPEKDTEDALQRERSR